MKTRFTYDGNEQGSYSIFDNERPDSPVILIANMGEDCVISLVDILNANSGAIFTEQ